MICFSYHFKERKKEQKENTDEKQEPPQENVLKSWS